MPAKNNEQRGIDRLNLLNTILKMDLPFREHLEISRNLAKGTTWREKEALAREEREKLLKKHPAEGGTHTG